MPDYKTMYLHLFNRVSDAVNALEAMNYGQAKELLMDRNHLSEEEAHRYIQKCSMDSGTNMVETAQMVLSMMQV